MKLFAALGNPGRKYINTRHNIAWLFVDFLQRNFSFNWKEKFKGMYSQENICGEKVIFLKPLTYMNLSGESVAAARDFFKVQTSNVLVVHDEIDLPFGQLAFKKGGGLAGHNGLKSIAERLSTKDFYRLRLGVGRPQRGDVSSYVLSKFSRDEGIVLENYFKQTEEAFETFISSGYEKASTAYNKKDLI